MNKLSTLIDAVMNGGKQKFCYMGVLVGPSRSGTFNFTCSRATTAEGFAGRIHILQSKVCMLLQDMPTDISLHKHT
jgi:hypothetical protein